MDHLGVILGPSWGHLGAILGPPWGLLGPSWAILGPSWAILGLSWPILGPSWGHIGAKLPKTLRMPAKILHKCQKHRACQQKCSSRAFSARGEMPKTLRMPAKNGPVISQVAENTAHASKNASKEPSSSTLFWAEVHNTLRAIVSSLFLPARRPFKLQNAHYKQLSPVRSSSGPLGGILGHLWASWGLLGPSWNYSWVLLGPRGAILGPLGALLGPSWGILGPSWGHLKPY